MNSIAQKAADIAIAMANDNSHGYDQENRWGPDYDCSSFVATVYKMAGVDTGATYTGDMLDCFVSKGFTVIAGDYDDLLPGDVLLNVRRHCAIYIGNGKIVAARSNENGAITGGVTGDQTGMEICTQDYYRYWNYVLRYDVAESMDADVYHVVDQLPMLKMGAIGVQVAAVQGALSYKGYSVGWHGVDGEYGKDTVKAVMRFQTDCKIEVDGIVGPETYTRLLGGY